MMNIKVTSISVGNQEQALRLSTDTPSPHPRNRTASSCSSPPMTTRRLDMDLQHHEDVTGGRRADASRVLNLSGET